MVSAEELGEGAAGTRLTSWRSAKIDGGIGVDLAVLQPRHAMVHAPRQLADLRMQRAAEGDVHLLQAAADAEGSAHPGRRTTSDQRQGHGVASLVVGLVAWDGPRLEAGRMHIGAGARQQHAVDRPPAARRYP
jgi:hypothetical protein